MKRKTIRNHRDFLTAPEDIGVRAPYFFVKTKPAKYPLDPRYGIIVSKRTLKPAVDRNRAKRLLCDWIYFNEEYMLSDLDYIFIITRNILGATREEGRDAMNRALKRIVRYHKTNANH